MHIEHLGEFAFYLVKNASSTLPYPLECSICVAAIGAMHFSAQLRMRTFYFGGINNEEGNCAIHGNYNVAHTITH